MQTSALANYTRTTHGVLIPPGVTLPGERNDRYERGFRADPENRFGQYLREWYSDPETIAAIRELRKLDKTDGRVKRIHTRTASQAVKDGLQMIISNEHADIAKRFKQFVQRNGLNNQQKLESHMRGLVAHGNCFLQGVLNDQAKHICDIIRMPPETMMPQVDETGAFTDMRKAYTQRDDLQGLEQTSFAAWQVQHARLDPENFDDHGSFGRPFLDSVRTSLKHLKSMEEDAVIRRKTRASQRNLHVLPGASEDEIQSYTERNERQLRAGAQQDLYSNKDGMVTPIEGDANMDQIADIVHVMESFFSGAPGSKALFGYAGDLNRDILEYLLQLFYEDVDRLQDILSNSYEFFFKLELLLAGIDPEPLNFKIEFKRRNTESLNQAADRGLKLQAGGAPQAAVWRAQQLDADEMLELWAEQRKNTELYPSTEGEGEDDLPAPKKVTISPNNGPKGESRTAVAGR